MLLGKFVIGSAYAISGRDSPDWLSGPRSDSPLPKMKLYYESTGKRHHARSAFSLIEVVVAVSIILVVFLTIFGVLTSGLTMTKASRENLRATQIMLDKMEGIRLYNWDQVTNGTTLLGSFTNYFFETNNIGTVSASGNGVSYTGLVSVAATPFSNSYSSSMRLISVQVGWVSGTYHSRSMSTYVSQDGLENYVYNN